jgi:hypothetical protein
MYSPRVRLASSTARTEIQACSARFVPRRDIRQKETAQLGGGLGPLSLDRGSSPAQSKSARLRTVPAACSRRRPSRGPADRLRGLSDRIDFAVGKFGQGVVRLLLFGQRLVEQLHRIFHAELRGP